MASNLINFIVPGLGNSGPEHWQTWFEQSGGSFQRINQREWDAPDREDWVSNIQQAVAGHDPATVILIGHSLGCTAIAHWANAYKVPVRGALLVAPSDIETPQYDFPATGFAPIPLSPLPFPSIVVASTNDPWVTINRAKLFADAWGSRFVNIGEAGHINVASGYTTWSDGLELLRSL
ncbi:RBBP9/YdeN family alpha/beta hydrolase [Flavihumibacter petaseus]|uniref:Alpha/beta hydrolase n=1 Tax=Flavihumibacter petaseus NBRC 106054 TaxID=1220578 RepID=A0A0E9N0Z8_9BACT|nr:alpha/beta hydrolase [Flavihumibacter petaseus]GAO43687.1 hypothetical protein FPE01S_02_07930 [Flavihumibacter petaseus NBRC 106054]